MPEFIESPTKVKACGSIPKSIEEYVGHVNSGTTEVSIAYMKSPGGWEEPGQTPQFNEYTLVLKGVLHVAFEGGERDVKAGQAIIAQAGEWIRYSSPGDGGAEYVAVCAPAFSPDAVRRDV